MKISAEKFYSATYNFEKTKLSEIRIAKLFPQLQEYLMQSELRVAK